MHFSRTACLPLLGLLSLVAADAALAQSAKVTANDNRRPAGVLAGGVLTVRFHAGEGEWRPEETDGPSLTVAAFGEEGGPLLTPGPLLRVPEGTLVTLHVRNSLTKRLDIHGLETRPATDDAVISIQPGETREIRFRAGSPGTYHYWATTAGSALNTRIAVESQLGGALIVDERGVVPESRVFVMTQWDDSRLRVDEIVNAEVRRVFAINGRSWPHTERLDERVGRAVRWHIVNLTQSGHPMHLHGFYFSVRGAGTGLRYTVYAREEHRQVVTETMAVGATRYVIWTPERAGNWLLHCHLIAHVTPALRFWSSGASSDHGAHGSHHATTAMAGLVMGIRVTGDEPAPKTPTSTSARRFTLSMHQRPGYWRPEDAYAFALEAAARTSEPRDAAVPGPLLVLTRNEPVEITLRNNLPEATAIHWHGIELESYYDGVPGWGGNGVSTTPAIEPGGQFVVRFTPPRAGTFIYHTHAHDTRQLASGLYGAIVVVEPGETFDPARDHVVLLGMEGTKDTQRYDRFPVVVNGKRDTVLTLKAGGQNRLRFINITTNFGGLNMSLIRANQPIQWRPVAKDGADLPLHQQTSRPALRQTVGVGETYDFVVEPSGTGGAGVPAGGGAWIEVRRANGEWVQQVPVRVLP
jgi:FtsP/CotA-like multicopper oxidase with cupredoxin domain